MINRLILFLLTTVFVLSGAESRAQSILDGYIQEALRSNIALRQEQLSYEKSLAALEEAKANFMPQLSLEARYSVARGGRAFTIPVGDLVNPIYQNLNVINELGQSASPDYPTIPEYQMIDNVQENFLRETEQETFVRVAMPVYNNAIINAQKIQANLAQAERISVQTYQRELIQEVKTAYFNYLKASEALELYHNTEALVQENLRTTESLFQNHQITKDAVFLAQAEVEKVAQQIALAEKNQKVAQSFFNFLLNRDYQSPIEVVSPVVSSLAIEGLESMRNQALQEREELRQIDFAAAASQGNLQMTKGSHLPTINLVADYGVQGTDYRLTDESDYFMGSVVMSWKLFQPANKARRQQAKIEIQTLQQQRAAVRQQISLQVVQAWYDLEAARKAVDQATAEVSAREQAFRLINKKYTQGQANLVNWTESQTQLTNARQKAMIARYDYQIKMAVLERSAATYPIQK
ncbi:MAG TPA: TolC family protein [Saprospiraceae bacterium]|nr:TolC family protein [Saprospiraceae bacterium]